MSNIQLALLEPSPLELWKVRGGGLVQFLRGLIPDVWANGFEQAMKHDALLTPYVGDHYRRTDVEAALEDDALTASLASIVGTEATIASRHPAMTKISIPVWLVIPWRVLGDRALRHRVARSLRATREVLESLRALRPDQSAQWSEPTAARESATWFVYDPLVPVEIAKRMLASVRARTTMDFLRSTTARQRWNRDDKRRALLDWADATDSALGFIASYPGISAPSLPVDQLFDLPAELERHRQRCQRLAEQAAHAATQLAK